MNNNFKNKYVFQKRRTLETLTIDEERIIRREIREYISDLANYDIDLKTLCEIKMPYQDRNNALNITLHLINDLAICQELVDTKKFPILKTSMLVKIPPNIIENYKEYLTAYMLLFGSEDYSNLLKYLTIGTKMDGNESGDERFLGLKLQDLGLTSVILTSQGEFRFLDVPQDSAVGTIVRGKEAVLRPRRTKIIGLSIVVLLIGIISFINYYQKPNKTIHIVSGPHIELKYNKFNTLINAKGINPQGDTILSSIIYSDKKFDSSVSEFLESGIKSGLIVTNEISIIVTEGNLTKEDFSGENLKRTIENHGLKLRINLKNSNALVIP